jgi:GNAT superfamily N-acetyltransferase
MRTCDSAEDMRLSLDIYNQVWPRRAVTQDDVDAWHRMSRASVELIGSVDGLDAGSAAMSVQLARPHLAYVLVTVLPRSRRGGVGGALFEAAARWTAAQGIDEIEAPVEVGDDESLAFAVRRGFTELSRDLVVELDLASLEPPPVDAPDGVDIELLAERPELAAGAYDVGLEALPDVPGSDGWTPPTFEQFTDAHLRGPAIFLAVASGDVVGYAKLHAGADGASAEHGMTGVKREWRGRGIAQSLKRAQIAWAKENGLERLIANNDERNIPMRRINDALGYRITSGWIQLHARVADLPLL